MGQWLQLRNLETARQARLPAFPDFDDNLRKAFRRETELLFANVLREGRPRARAAERELHVRQRAAGAPLRDSRASTVRASAAWSSRIRTAAGLFGHGSITPLTSAASRTSPIIRGKFIVTEFWNNPPPPPPADVPALEEARRRTGRRPCASSSSGTAPTRTAPRVTTTSIPWGSRSRTSTPTGSGATQTREGLDDRLGGRLGGRHGRRWARGVARGAARKARALRRHRHREDADLRARPRTASRPICRWCAQSCETRPSTITSLCLSSWV